MNLNKLIDSPYIEKAHFMSLLDKPMFVHKAVGKFPVHQSLSYIIDEIIFSSAHPDKNIRLTMDKDHLFDFFEENIELVQETCLDKVLSTYDGYKILDKYYKYHGHKHIKFSAGESSASKLDKLINLKYLAVIVPGINRQLMRYKMDKNIIDLFNIIINQMTQMVRIVQESRYESK